MKKTEALEKYVEVSAHITELQKVKDRLAAIIFGGKKVASIRAADEAPANGAKPVADRKPKVLKVPCQYCGKPLRPLGHGPHEARCSQNPDRVVGARLDDEVVKVVKGSAIRLRGVDVYKALADLGLAKSPSEVYRRLSILTQRGAIHFDAATKLYGETVEGEVHNQ